jgi:hypothetical protein
MATMNAYRLLTVAALVTTLGACEGMAHRTIEVDHSTGANAATVSKAVSEFATKEGFACREQAGTVVLECRALGPRFLSVESKPSSSVAELAQPFPWSPSGAPKDYQATVEAFTRYMSERFGAAARVTK